MWRVFTFSRLKKKRVKKFSQNISRITTRSFWKESYEIYKDDFIATPYPITQGLETTYEYVAQRRPEIYSHKAEEFTDPSFIAELDKSGFIKKLYGQK